MKLLMPESRAAAVRRPLVGLLIAMCLSLDGCAVVAVADLAVTTAATVVSTGVKATGAVVDAVLPSSGSKK